MTDINDTIDTNQPGFQKFVDQVSPRTPRGIQPVFLPELLAVLQVLWQIYQFLDKMGFFKKWLTVFHVKKAMQASSVEAKQAALEVVRDRCVVPVKRRW